MKPKSQKNSLLFGLLLASVLAVATIGLAACGGGDEDEKAGDETAPAQTEKQDGGAGETIDVSLKEFSVNPAKATAKAGKVTFDIKNDGAQPHDLWVIKTDLAADALPVKGGVADEKGEGVELIDKTATFNGGESESLTVDLEPGKYVLICNVPGHYEAGMTTEFEVE